MKFSEPIQKLLSAKYEPSAMVYKSYRGNDLAFKTDNNGNPILLFIGKKNETGTIKGDRYARTLKYDEQGAVIKDHWERKGKAT